MESEPEYIDTEYGLHDTPENTQDNTASQPKGSERTWGQATEDVVSNMLDSLVSGDNVIQIVGSGIQAGMNTPGYQAMKAKQISEARKAELELNILQNRDALIHMARLHAEEDRPYQQQMLENQAEKSDIELENARLGLTNNRQLSANNLLKMRHEQDELFRAGWQREEDAFKSGLKNSIGFERLNFMGQSIIDNSFGIDTLADANTIVRAFIRSPEEGKAALREQGWSYNETDNKIISPDGKVSFSADEKTLTDLMKQANERAKQDIAAAMTLGQDAQTLEQFAMKNVLLQKNVADVFGSYGSALGAYQRFVNSKDVQTDGKRVVGSQPRYTKEQKLGHILSVGLKAAILDNKISDIERQTLTPLMAAYFKKFGAEVKFGNGIDDTFIKRMDGTTVPLTEFTKGLEERDVIGADWSKYVANVRQTVQENEKKEAVASNTEALSKIYGPEVYKLDDEKLSALNKINNSSNGYALTLGVAKKDQSGRVIIPENVSLDELQKVAEFEKERLKDFELEGFWEAEYKRRKALSDDMKNARRRQKSSELLKQRKDDEHFERRQTMEFYNAMGPGMPQI